MQKRKKHPQRNAFLYQLFSWPQVITRSGLGKNAKICRPIGQDGAKLAAEDSAVEAYLLVGAVLKPEVDRRQLTIYAPSAAPCKNPEPNFSAVLWLLGRWAEPSHKPREARAFKKSFFFPSEHCHWRSKVTCLWHHRSRAGQLFLLPSSAAFLCFPSSEEAWFAGSSWHSGEGRGGCDAAAATHESWGFEGGRERSAFSLDMCAYFFPSCSLSTSPSFLVAWRAVACLCWPWGDVRIAAYNVEGQCI